MVVAQTQVAGLGCSLGSCYRSPGETRGDRSPAVQRAGQQQKESEGGEQGEGIRARNKPGGNGKAHFPRPALVLTLPGVGEEGGPEVSPVSPSSRRPCVFPPTDHPAEN